MRLSLLISSLLIAAVSAAVPRTRSTLTTLQAPEDTSLTTPTQTTSPTPTPTESPTPTQEAEEEDRRVGVNGWLGAPTQAPVDIPKPGPSLKLAKPGLCESPKGYGIKCMSRMDQCGEDQGCPGVTKCCEVGECGRLCVKPKPTAIDAKELVKEGALKKKEGSKDGNKKEETTQEEEEEEVLDVQKSKEEEVEQEDERSGNEEPQDIQGGNGNKEDGNVQVTQEIPEIVAQDEEERDSVLTPTDVDF